MITPVAQVWWLRPLINAARVGEQSAVVWNLVYLNPGLRNAFKGRRRNRSTKRSRCSEADIVRHNQQYVRSVFRCFDLCRKIQPRLCGAQPHFAIEWRLRDWQHGTIKLFFDMVSMHVTSGQNHRCQQEKRNQLSSQCFLAHSFQNCPG